MPESHYTSPWSIIAVLCTGLLAIYQFLSHRNLTAKIQAHDLGKGNALGDVFFLYEATPKLLSANGKKLLEIEIKVTNKSAKKLGILAIYVKFKPIINTSRQEQQNFKNFDELPDFDNTDLEKNCSLINLKNAAYLKDSIWQTSVEGVTVRRSFDLVDEAFCKKYPLVMAQITIMGSSMDKIDKTHYPKYDMGKLRLQWFNYMTERELENYNCFSRMKKGGYAKGGWSIKQSERTLINKDGTFDVDNTIKFEDLLQSVINSNIEKVIDLRG